MREILFRGMTIHGDEWIEGDLVHIEDGRCLILSNTRQIYDDIDCYSLEVYPKTVGQYIGLKDKNGKKVFEDDVLEDETRFCTSRYLVDHEFSSFTYTPIDNVHGLLEYSTPIDDNEFGITVECTEVIGNMHDEPWLIIGDLGLEKENENG